MGDPLDSFRELGEPLHMTRSDSTWAQLDEVPAYDSDLNHQETEAGTLETQHRVGDGSGDRC